MSARKKATEFILKWIGEIVPGDKDNVKLLRDHLNKLTDAEFDAYMAKLEKAGEPEGDVIPFYAPNFSDKVITVDNNLRVARELDTQLWQRIWYTDPITHDEVLSREKALIVYLPVRRQAQTQAKKESVPLDERVRDDMSGQVTGDSKGGKLSYPELQALAGQGLDEPVLEMIKFRGGDEVAEREMNAQLTTTGQANFDKLMELGSRPKSIETMAALLDGMHLDNEI